MSSDDASERPTFTLLGLLIFTTVVVVALAVGTAWVNWMAASKGAWPVGAGNILWAAPILMLWMSTFPLQSRPLKSATIFETMSHGTGLLGLVAYLLMVVPAFANVFREFDLKLPLSAQWMLATSEFAVGWADLVIPLVISLVVIDCVVFAILYAAPARRIWAKTWSGGITFVLLATMSESVVMTFSPLITIIKLNG